MTNDLRFLVVSGPSGVGKSTIAKNWISQRENVKLSRSATTREPRKPGEKDRYLFLEKDEFKKLIKEDAFIEWANVFDQYYGTLKRTIRDIQNKGKLPLLEIDPQGADQIREQGWPHISIFIEPPDLEELQNRLQKRGTDSDEEQQKRLQEARKEMKSIPKYHYRIVNDELDSVVNRLNSILDYEMT